MPLKEEDAYPAMPEDGYGWEKLFSERMCRHFREDFGFPRAWPGSTTSTARLARGTADGRRLPRRFAGRSFTRWRTGENGIEIWGSGEQTRSFMYIDDCIKGILQITASDIIEPINLGSNELVTINQLVDIVEDIAGVKLERRYNLAAPKGVNGRNSDNTRIKKLLGWEPSIPLRTGMETTYRWIHDEYVKANGAKRS